jgi:hypothetical protein
MFRKYKENSDGDIQTFGKFGAYRSTSKRFCEPFWLNDWFPPFDCAVLYGLVAEKKPRRYIEVGSGISTRFARQAIKDYDLDTRVISIDPHPHNAVDELCDEVICSRMEDLGSDFWGSVGEGDMLFVDNSHRSFPNSDVTVFLRRFFPPLEEGRYGDFTTFFFRMIIRTNGEGVSTMSNIC